jgi:hypothetical protein
VMIPAVPTAAFIVIQSEVFLELLIVLLNLRPFGNLPDRTEGALGRGSYLPKMDKSRWLDPFIVARIELLEWTPENRLRHARFAGLRGDKDAREVVREARP